MISTEEFDKLMKVALNDESYDFSNIREDIGQALGEYDYIKQGSVRNAQLMRKFLDYIYFKHDSHHRDRERIEEHVGKYKKLKSALDTSQDHTMVAYVKFLKDNNLSSEFFENYKPMTNKQIIRTAAQEALGEFQRKGNSLLDVIRTVKFAELVEFYAGMKILSPNKKASLLNEQMRGAIEELICGQAEIPELKALQAFSFSEQPFEYVILDGYGEVEKSLRQEKKGIPGARRAFNDVKKHAKSGVVVVDVEQSEENLSKLTEAAVDNVSRTVVSAYNFKLQVA